ncbi:MAG: OprO/OprP family phosphate-selective porin, partial [candidate division KSB1 bacterium]|nr:OprO/OprP family phosphate-selective porin [candidate division KSB1 bacterium]
MRIRGLLLFCLAFLPFVLKAQIESKIDGLVYSDYYYQFKNSINAEKDRNAFQFRRIYFTFENNITQNIKVRFRLESEHASYGSATKINPFVKHAYLEWTNLIPQHRIYFGLAETNAFKNSEEYWGYRSIEKTIMDLQKISSSADMGISLKGDLLGGKVHHWLTVFNGTGCGSSEIDRFKKIGYAFWLTPIKGLILEGYYDFESQDPTGKQTAANLSSAKDYAAGKGYNTVKGFVGYDHPRFTLGAEAFFRTNEKSGIENVATAYDDVKKEYKITASTPVDVKRFGYSVFGSVITPIPKLKAFARYDFFDNNNEDNVSTKFDKATGKLTSGTDDEFTMIFAGLDYIPSANLHIMPNVIIKSYAKDGLD